MSRRARIGLSAVSLFILTLIVLLVIFDWNWLRGPVGAAASVRLGRTVEIVGDLKVHPWSLSPSAEAYDVRIAQPAWVKSDADMARIGKLAVQLEIPPLFAGRTVLPMLEVIRPRLELVRLADGRANWTFGGKGGDRGLKLPAIRRFVITDGRINLNDLMRRTRFSGTVYTDETADGADRGEFALRGEGRLNGARFIASVTGDPLLNVSPNRPWPFRADVRAGATRIQANARIVKPFDLGRFEGSVTLTGADLNDLYGLTGLTLPNTPPYSASGQIARRGTLYRLERATGRIGDSDLSGDLSVETRGERPFLTADLRSRRLDFDDLGSLFGGPPATRRGETASPEQAAMAGRLRRAARLFPDATLQVERIRAMDAKVTYRAETVNAPGLPLSKVALTLDLKDGMLTGDPVALTFSRGSISGLVRLDARGEQPRTDVDLRLTGARLEDWIKFGAAGGQPAIEGQIVARARLTGHGNSVRKAAASADGTLTIVSPRGEIRQAFAELLGVNVFKGLYLLLSEDPRQTAIRCAVADFQVKDGIARSNRIVIDTGVVLVTGSGVINLKTERLNLLFEGESKKPRLLRLYIPIRVDGPLVKPGATLQTGNAVAQGGVAVALASLLSPLAAILPFVEAGLAEDANCAALVARGRAKGAPVRGGTTPANKDADR
ncbi:MAG: AsmA family protein [Caulobacter sp.]|nr:AsmA family protein [Caulobacter sp.]